MDVPSSKKSTWIYWFNVKEKSYSTITHYQCKWDKTWRLLKNNEYIWEHAFRTLHRSTRYSIYLPTFKRWRTVIALAGKYYIPIYLLNEMCQLHLFSAIALSWNILFLCFYLHMWIKSFRIPPLVYDITLVSTKYMCNIYVHYNIKFTSIDIKIINVMFTIHSCITYL